MLGGALATRHEFPVDVLAEAWAEHDAGTSPPRHDTRPRSHEAYTAYHALPESRVQSTMLCLKEDVLRPAKQAQRVGGKPLSLVGLERVEVADACAPDPCQLRIARELLSHWSSIGPAA